VLKANLRFCVQVRRGAIRRSTLAPTPLARVALFAGAGLAYGIAHECVDRETTPQTLANFGAGTLDDRFHEPDHGTGDLLVDSSFAVR